MPWAQILVFLTSLPPPKKKLGEKNDAKIRENNWKELKTLSKDWKTKPEVQKLKGITREECDKGIKNPDVKISLEFQRYSCEKSYSEKGNKNLLKWKTIGGKLNEI
jgi:hypothetical protein